MTSTPRYALVDVPPGGVLMDRESGNVLRLNEAAALVWRLQLNGEPQASIAKVLASTYAIDEVRAKRDVADALGATVCETPAPPVTDFGYHRSATGYVQSFRGTPVLEVDGRGERLRAVTPKAQPAAAGLRDFLRALAPKILSLRGRCVLHASGVAISGRLLAFLGASGAGKTTMARALVKEGATAIGEDKLLVRVQDGQPCIWVDGERQMDAWTRRATVALLADGHCECSTLEEVAAGTLLPLAELGFLDVSRRRGEQLLARPLTPLDVAGAVFHATFLGSEAPAAWTLQLETAAAIGKAVSGFELTTPETLSALAVSVTELAVRGTLRHAGQ